MPHLGLICAWKLARLRLEFVNLNRRLPRPNFLLLRQKSHQLQHVLFGNVLRASLVDATVGTEHSRGIGTLKSELRAVDPLLLARGAVRNDEGTAVAEGCDTESQLRITFWFGIRNSNEDSCTHE